MKRYTVEVNHKVVKECDSPKEAEHFYRQELAYRRGSGERVIVYDNRDDKYMAVGKA